MYEENRTGFILKDILLQIILVVIFVFLLLWLFPTKGYVNNKMENSLSPVYQELFNSHLQSMKEAAQSYYTKARLPKKVGDKVSITLGEMYDKKLVAPFVDSNNKQCSLTASYVEITKMDDEYMMKVNLSCSDKSDYIIAYLGCYDYCDGLCEKEENKNTTTTTKPNSNNNSSSKPTSNKKYQYEYKIVKAGYYTDWSSWSTWSTTKLSETDVRDREQSSYELSTGTKTYTVDAKKNQTPYNVTTQLKCPSGYDPYWNNSEKGKICVAKPSTGTTTSTVPTYVDAVSTYIKVCPDGSTPINDYCPAVINQDVKPATVVSSGYSNWTYVGRQTFTGTKVTNDTTRYDYVSSKDDFACSDSVNCSKVTKNTYDVYTRTKSTQYSCSAYPGYKLSGTNCVKDIMGHVYGIWTVQTKTTCQNGATPVNGKCPVYSTTTTTKCTNGGSYDSNLGLCYKRGEIISVCPSGVNGEIIDGKCVVEKYSCDRGVYNEATKTCTITENKYETITYYRYRTRSYVPEKTETAWSSSKNDKDLLNKGYVLTGKQEEVTKA